MKKLLTQRTLTSDWEERHPSSSPVALGVGSRLGPFVVGQLLGQGGMGVVYAATHVETGAELALKTLHRVDTRAEARLKSEFRHLAKLRHPRLVQLYELHTIDSHCFLTMERVDGVSLSDKLEEAKQGGAYYDSLRDLFRQVAEGLLALHAENLLHLDLKPDNVMVARDDSVRILDFGLTLPLAEREVRHRRGVGGTPRYMAPERLARGEESTSSDWYSFGVMLAEHLGAGKIAPHFALRFPEEAPSDLVDLCHSLLKDSPEERPRGEDVALQMGVALSGEFRISRPGSLLSPKVVGREVELGQLERALGHAVRGGSSWIRLSGESGIGKTVLMQKFRNDLLAEPGICVLQGVCHERESVPFQGLDGILEDLAAQLAQRKTACGRAERVLLEHALSLSDAFLDLCQAPPVATLPQNPLERRRAAFSAVKGLVSALTRTETVVVLLDDVHWGDTDGARLLAEILATPTPRHLLLVTTSRPEGHGPTPFLEELDTVLGVRNTTLRKETIQLERLAPHHTMACVRTGAGRPNLEQSGAIARAAGGLPFLAAALGSHPWTEEETPSLRALIELRLRDAPPGASAVLQAISLSPSPLPQAVALEQVADARLRGAVLAALRNSDLVRTSGATPDAPLEPYHALVAKTVQDQLNLDAQRRVRAKIAASLEEKQIASSEQLAHLFHLAGNSEKAAHWAPIAAQDAERSLAFESAAHWFGRAADWVPDQAALYLPKQARCLEYSGRSAEAARCYEKCALLVPEMRGAYLRAAGASWLNAGHVDRGLATLVPDLEDLGVPISKSERAALARSLYLLWKLWKRGTDFRALPEASCDPTLLSRVDAVWHAAKVLGAPVPLRGLALQLQCLLLSLETGEIVRIARSLAVLGPTFVGTPWEKMGAEWSKKARELGDLAENDYLHGILLTFDAVRMTARWEDPEKILKSATEAHRILAKEHGTIAWEQSMALTASLRVREQLGRFDELRQLGTQWLAESTDRGDLFAQAMAYQASAMGYLAGDEVEQARMFTQRSVERWGHGSFTVQHYYALRYEVQCDLFSGQYRAAQDKLLRLWPVLKRAQLLRHPISRPELLLLRGLVDVAVCVESRAISCPEVERLGEFLLKDQNRVSRAHGLLLKTSCSWLRSPTQEALRGLEVAKSEYLEAGQLLQAECLELTIAQATGDKERRERVVARLLASGVKSPHRYLRVHVPVVFQTPPLHFAS